MVTQLNNDLTDEVVQVLNVIAEGKNFLLSGGAGSGKTYSLVEIIRNLVQVHPLAKITCITYTNSAVREIEERVSHPNVQVSTIHDFLWDSIKHFQNELKTVLLDLINSDDDTHFEVVDENGEAEKLASIDGEIRYKEFVRLREGIVSHDEIIVLANKMYERYTKLCRIVQDSNSFILVDEYQDTNRKVIEILLTYLNRSGKPNIVGFFGDAMQSIYEDGIGNLDEFKGEGYGKVSEIKKLQNRRNPKLIIDLANVLRNDGLIQTPSDDKSAPNMTSGGTVKIGSLKFLYSSKDDLQIAKSFLQWDFSKPKITKELNLTHNLIATKAGFGELMRVYDGDKILDYVRRIKKHIKEKARTTPIEGKTFGEVITYLKVGKTGKELDAVNPTKGMATYIEEHTEAYNLALSLSYLELASLYVDKDQLIDDKKNDETDESGRGVNRDDLVKHLFKIQRNLHLYATGRYNEFLRVTNYVVESLKDKLDLKNKIDSLANSTDKTIEQVITEADRTGIVKIDDRLLKFRERKRYVYNEVSKLPFSEFQKLFEYLEGFTPFSTQHKTKGDEFPNVLVVLNNGNWNNYNFEYLFTDQQGKESVVSRTRKILYVCCTRAKENLAVFYHQPAVEVIEKAKKWFGKENVVNLDETLRT
jgi:DNA helicase-2/ATP-dependent DNA helicase PcrA